MPIVAALLLARGRFYGPCAIYRHRRSRFYWTFAGFTADVAERWTNDRQTVRIWDLRKLRSGLRDLKLSSSKLGGLVHDDARY